MAYISVNTMKKTERDIKKIHEEVNSSYNISFMKNGENIIQIDTFGKNDRKIKDKVSQSIQFNDDVLRILCDEVGLKNTVIERDSDECGRNGEYEQDVIEQISTQEEKDILINFFSVDVIKEIHNYISSKGYNYDESLIKNFYISLKTKPFVILSGISGTGKSKIVELFAEAIGATSENNRFKLIPVKPDWSDSTDLLGYRNIEGEFTTGIITDTAYEAIMNPEVPYIICLDEMNLARVEYYLSDILSIMETRKVNEDGKIVTDILLRKEQFGRDVEAIDKYGDIYLPENLYIVGTVNMDETTFPFSKKVLDRANTIEFNEVNLDYLFEDNEVQAIEAKNYHNDLLKSDFLKIVDCKEHKVIGTKVISKLSEINNILQEYNQHFGYRVRDEILFYMIYATRDEILTFDKAFDMAVVQKILPKINGSSQEVLEILIKLFDLFNNYKTPNKDYIEELDINNMKGNATDKYKLTNNKLIYMIRRFVRDGFTSFWQ